VDAFTAQEVHADTRPISIVFALAGLLLAVERGWTGREVQLFHMKMAKHKRPWPVLSIPLGKAAIDVHDVLQAGPGPARDEKIKEWCASVWQEYAQVHETIRELVGDFAVWD
jgi:hypothetical protein